MAKVLAVAFLAISSLPADVPAADVLALSFKAPFLRKALLADRPRLCFLQISIVSIFAYDRYICKTTRLASLRGFNSFLKSLNDNDS